MTFDYSKGKLISYGLVSLRKHKNANGLAFYGVCLASDDALVLNI